MRQEEKQKVQLLNLGFSDELVIKLQKILQDYYNTNEYSILNIEQIKFKSGESKITLLDSIRNNIVFVLIDITNRSKTYKMYDLVQHYSPTDYFQDLLSTISAVSAKAKKLIVVMPLLYESRQHRRKMRESLDCAATLRMLEDLGVDELVTFDAHDPGVQSSLRTLPFDNMHASLHLIENLLDDVDNCTIAKEPENYIIIAPDSGAMEKAVYYASRLKTDLGFFYKRRDYTKIVNGKNPIISYDYAGSSLTGKHLIIVDDMISSGDSIYDIAKVAKSKGALDTSAMVTFALFTEGMEKLRQFKQEGLIKNIYCTNLNYMPEEYFNDVIRIDMTQDLAEVIYRLSNGTSIHDLLEH